MTQCQVQVQLFGAFRKYSDGALLQVELEPRATVKDLRMKLAAKLLALHPDFSETALIQDSAFATHSEVLSNESPVVDGQTIALLPPVCGG